MISWRPFSRRTPPGEHRRNSICSDLTKTETALEPPEIKYNGSSAVDLEFYPTESYTASTRGGLRSSQSISSSSLWSAPGPVPLCLCLCLSLSLFLPLSPPLSLSLFIRQWLTKERKRIDVWNERTWEICLKGDDGKGIGGKFGIGGRGERFQKWRVTRDRQVAGQREPKQPTVWIPGFGASADEVITRTDQSRTSLIPREIQVLLPRVSHSFVLSSENRVRSSRCWSPLFLSLFSVSFFLSRFLSCQRADPPFLALLQLHPQHRTEHLAANRTEFDESAAITLAFATVPFFSGVVNLSLSSGSITDRYFTFHTCNLIDILFCNWYTYEWSFWWIYLWYVDNTFAANDEISRFWDGSGLVSFLSFQFINQRRLLAWFCIVDNRVGLMW